MDRGKYLFFNEVDGLPRNIITCVEQDKYGYTWIGTGNGISRFDGKEFKNYEQLKGQVIWNLYIDNKDNLWIASEQGFFFYNRINDHFEIKFEGSVKTIQEYSDDIYFANYNKIMKLNSDEVTDVIEANNITDFCITKEGFWHGNGSEGARFINHSQVNNVNTTVLKGKSVAVIREIEGIIYFGCSNGELFILKPYETEIKVAIENHHEIKEIIKVNSEIWVATDGNGIIILDEKLNYDKSLNRGYNNIPKFKSNSIYDIYLGQNNEVWIATYGAGLLCLIDDTSPFTNIVPQPGVQNSLVASEGVFALMEGQKIYFGTNYGLSVYEEKTGKFTNMDMKRLRADLKGTKVLAVNTDQQNNLWIGTYDGLLGKYTSNLELIRTYQPCGDNATDMQRIIFLQKCKQNNLLIATHYRERSLLNFNLKTETVTPISVTIDGNIRFDFQLMSLRENREGETLALLRNEGLYTVNPEKNILENNLPEINRQITFQMNDFYHDKKGYYWLTTQAQGLIRISEDGREFDQWRTEQGLPTNTLLQIESIDNRYVWISTISGICRFDMETGSVLIFNHKHGLPVDEFIARASTITDDGRLIFGSTAGFTIVDLEKVMPDTSESKVIISDIIFHNQSIKKITDKPILTVPLEETRKIELPFKRNSFTIHFFSKDKSLPKFNNYAYRLLGLEENWIYLGETKHTTYTNLSPGKYTFEIKNTNKSNVWSTNPTQLAIHINPPWYMSWYAIAFYAVFILLIIGSAMYTYTYQVKLRKEIEFSEFKINAEHELTEKKLAFFTNISHDLKTPLTLIDAPVNELLHSEDIDEKHKDKLILIRRNSQRLYKLITDLLDFRKLSNNQLPLKVSETNITDIIENIYQTFKEEFSTKKIDFERSSSVREKLFVDSKKIEKILWNLLSNAIKYTESDGEVFLSAQEQQISNNIYLKLTVKDSGIGIPAEEQNKIFNRFYQYDKNEGPAIKGTGIGLSIVKELVDLHHGSIDLYSTEGVGTTFTITIPAERKLFAESEIDLEISENHLLYQKENYNKDLQIQEYKQSRYSLPKVLFVEDNQELREYLVGFFKKNFKVYSAKDGREGLGLAKEKNPDIIITDVLMPNMNGYEFCNEIRNSFETSHIPILMLTSNSSIEQQIKGVSTGADAYITKPFSIDLLETSVYTIIANRKKLRNRFLGVGQIDESENTLTQKDSDFIDVLKAFIDDNLAEEKLNIETLADHFSLSKSQLNRKIKSLTGQTPNNLIKSIRLKKAFELIKNEGLRVSEASYKVGFSDPNYFTLCFSKEFGENPSKI